VRRWQNPSNVTDIPKAMSSFGAAYSTYLNYTNSPSVFGDALFLRLKTLPVSYLLLDAATQRQRLQGVRVSVKGQNLFTITRYNGSDPWVPGFVLPSMRLLTGDVQVSI